MAIEGDIQGVLSALVSGRAYPMIAPDPVAKPYIIFQVISDIPENDLDGFAGISRRRVQVDAYAETFGAAKTLATSIKTAMAGANFNGLHLSSQDLHEPELQLYRVSADFSVWS